MEPACRGQCGKTNDENREGKEMVWGSWSKTEEADDLLTEHGPRQRYWIETDKPPARTEPSQSTRRLTPGEDPEGKKEVRKGRGVRLMDSRYVVVGKRPEGCDR